MPLMTGYQFGKFPLVLQGNTKGCLFHNQAGPPFCGAVWVTGDGPHGGGQITVSKENMKRFLEKAAATPALAEKLDAAQKEYEEKVVTLARKTGFQITQEACEEAMKPLNDDDMENVSGGWNPWGPIFP